MVRQALALLNTIGLPKRLETPSRAANSSSFRFRLSSLALEFLGNDGKVNGLILDYWLNDCCADLVN